MKSFLVDLKNNKIKDINYIISPELIELIDHIGELLADLISEKGGLNTIFLDSNSPSPADSSNCGPSNTGLYSYGPSNTGQPEGSGSNRGNNSVLNTPEAVFNHHIKDTAQKLRYLYITKPFNVEINMNSPEYADRINEMDHNVLCSHVLNNTDEMRWKKHVILDTQGRVRYNGNLTRLLMLSLQEKADSI